MALVSRGFRGRRRDDRRLPPGQYVTDGFPVFSAGPTPHTPLHEWTFTIEGADGVLASWTWPQFRALSSETITCDIHCVTRWSKLGTTWTGVSLDLLLEGLEADEPYALFHCDGGYTTSLPIEDVTNGRAWIAHAYEGAALEPEHGGPARLLVPHLYLWKERQVGARCAAAVPRRAWLLGVARVPPPRRPVEGGTPLGRLTWRPAEVVDARAETARARSLTIAVIGWEGHRPGQHVDLRLTAEDGYEAVRSYSLAAPADGDRIVLTVERIDDGEVSPWLVDEALPGDRLEVRGPIGGYFAWDQRVGGPLLLVAGGSGIVPLAAIARSRDRTSRHVPARLLYSVACPQDAIYRDELRSLGARGSGLDVIFTFTRTAPQRWTGYRRRVDRTMLGEVGWPASSRALAYVCGPTTFVEAVADALRALGYGPDAIRTERFGPTGARA